MKNNRGITGPQFLSRGHSTSIRPPFTTRLAKTLVRSRQRPLLAHCAPPGPIRHALLGHTVTEVKQTAIPATMAATAQWVSAVPLSRSVSLHLKAGEGVPCNDRTGYLLRQDKNIKETCKR